MKRLENPTSAREVEKYRAMAEHFRKYGEQYGSDWVLAIAQGYQESQLDQSKRSSAGAVGVMQIKPSTAADRNVGIDNVENLENNIHASLKYMRFLRDRYFADEGIDPLEQRPVHTRRLQRGPCSRGGAAAEGGRRSGLDPNQWFNNVEVIAAREIGRETVDYVSNIYKYYSAYKAYAARQEAAGGAN